MNERARITNQYAKLLAAAIALAIAAFVCVSAMPKTAWADLTYESTPASYKANLQRQSHQFPGWNGKYDTGGIHLYKGKITDVKSSNTKVLTVKTGKFKDAEGYGDEYKKCWYITPTLKKAGRATLSYKINGKKYSVKYVAYKSGNPFAKLTIGGKNYTKKFKRIVNWRYTLTVKKLAGKKLVAKAAKGWKITKMTATAASKTKKVKSGKMLPAGTESITMTVKHKESGSTKQIEIEV